MKLAPLALALTITASAFAQAPFSDPANLRGERVRPHDGRELPVDQGASGLQQLLRKLNTRASILNIVAHPDDEDGGMLAFYSRGLGARVADMSLTRGEGGQNAMTGDFEDALGLLRTQELLASDRYPGIDQFFGTEVDFGFSKTKEEAFSKWTHERVLYDAVRAIRLYRPLVITATFIGGVTDGHGQHQVSGQIAQEAFKAAADPKVFPEMIAEGILPWQALKLYARVPMQSIRPQGLFDYATGQYAPAKFTNYVTGEVTTTQPSVNVVVHEGTPDALLGGKSYVQFARIGLGMQKSQIGPGVRNAPGGAFDVSYHRYGSRVANQPAHEESFFDGIDISLATYATADTTPAVRSALQKFVTQMQSIGTDPNAASSPQIAARLADAKNTVDHLVALLEHVPAGSPDASLLHELRIKDIQLNDALALALGLTLDATTRDRNHVVWSKPVVTSQLSCTWSESLDVKSEWMTNSGNEAYESETQKDRDAEVSAARKFTRTLTPTSVFTLAVSRPYFERDSIETPVYHLRIADLRNAPVTPASLTVWATVLFHGVPVTVGRIVHDDAQSIAFSPEANVTLDRHAQVMLPGATSISIQAHVTQGAAIHEGKTYLRAPAGWISKPSSQPLSVADPGFVVSAPMRYSGRGEKLTIEADTRLGNRVSEGFREVGYGDLPRTNFFTPATDRIVPVDLKLATRNKIAYLAGTGDDVPDALASIGLKPTILTVADLTVANLAQYDTVILGVRTYNAHPDLHGAPTKALFDYARNGGNVVVQYQTTEFTGADAPYPLSLGSNEKVVDETTPVQLLAPTNPLLTTPNRITPGDFNGWVEERGHGFLSNWDQHYTALTETHDPGGPETQPQAPQRGGLITTPLGKGRWTYCAFALYRQLPEAVPGAYRLFVNLLNP